MASFLFLTCAQNTDNAVTVCSKHLVTKNQKHEECHTKLAVPACRFARVQRPLQSAAAATAAQRPFCSWMEVYILCRNPEMNSACFAQKVGALQEERLEQEKQQLGPTPPGRFKWIATGIVQRSQNKYTLNKLCKVLKVTVRCINQAIKIHSRRCDQRSRCRWYPETCYESAQLRSF